MASNCKISKQVAPASGRAALNPRSVVLFCPHRPLGAGMATRSRKRIKVDWVAEAPKELWRQASLARIGAT